MSVSRDDLENDRYGTYAPLFTELGQTAAAHPSQLVFGLLKNGFATRCYDAQYFFDTDHQVNGAALSNSAGGTGTAWYLLDTSRSLKPLIFQERRRYQLQRMGAMDDEHLFTRNEHRGVDGRCNVGFGLWQMAYGSKQTLNATNYASARTAMLGMKGNDGVPMGVVPNLLVVPPTLESKAIVVSTLAGGGETNEWAGSAELLTSTWLS